MLTAFTDDLANQLATHAPDVPLKQAAPRYLEDPRGKFEGLPGFVAAPRTSEDTARILAFANTHKCPIQPYGGGTGLVAGQITLSGPTPLILSMDNMTAHRDIRPTEYSRTAEAGVTIEAIQNAAAEANRLFPLSYASKGTAQIGAGLSVNSGGLNVLRYGMARDTCLGIEAVLPDGSILHGLKRLRKDNTGYDLRHLIIGAEGTLGIITAAALKLSPQPQNIATAFLQVSSPAAALDLLAMLWDQAGEVVSAFELIAGTGLDMLAETYPDTRQPFDTPPEWSVLVEIGTGASTDATEILETLYMLAHEKGLTGDGIIASSGQQRDAFWTARETMPAANKAIGSIASHDISVPLSELPGFIDAADTAINKLGTFRINAFGHLGDGNLHYNIFPPKGRSRDDYRNLSPQITRIVHDLTDERGGSVSAEHGLGRLKPDELKRYGDPTKIALMRQIKATLDPNGIMNPGAVLPEG